jgi:hypothetical protein
MSNDQWVRRSNLDYDLKKEKWNTFNISSNSTRSALPITHCSLFIDHCNHVSTQPSSHLQKLQTFQECILYQLDRLVNRAGLRVADLPMG